MNTNKQLRNLVLLALFVAIELVFRLIGLGRVPVGPLNMSFMTVPIAVGAMLLGPWQGMVLGCVFGLCSLWDAATGAGGMTAAFYIISPVHTFILCVGMRALMGLMTGMIFKWVRRIDRTKTVPYFVGAFCAPFLNTLFFMGYIVLVFYHVEYVQELVTTKGAVNPLVFVVLLVGVQGLIEMLVCTITGGAVAKGVSAALKNKQ